MEAARPLARSLHRDIVRLGHRLEHAATTEEELRRLGSRAGENRGLSLQLVGIIADMKALLDRIDRDTPSLQLAISVSGESLSTALPPGISPSRLLQSSILLTMGDTQFAQDPSRPVQIGPSFTVALYMLFVGHANPLRGHHNGSDGNLTAELDGASFRSLPSDFGYGIGERDRKPLWQEVMHKARVRLCRTPLDFVFDPMRGFVPASEDAGDYDGYGPVWGAYAYHVEIIEDLDDGLVHDDAEGVHGCYDTIQRAGIRESMPVYQISKVFYTDTGRILNIGNTMEAESNPVLLLKRDLLAKPPRWMGDSIAPHWDDVDGNEATESTFGLGHPDDDSDSELEVDRQLREESEARGPSFSSGDHHSGHGRLRFPPHLDPEWIALEAFEENDDGSVASGPGDAETGADENFVPQTGPRGLGDRSSIDSRLISQIKQLSIGPEAIHGVTAQASEQHARVSTTRAGHASPEHDQHSQPPEYHASFVARSPFGAITTSLSLMEILIRLSSLQQFQQATHLSIPDYMLNFFLEDTSTTGLRGEESWRMRHEAKRRVGFDPYTDTPTKQQVPPYSVSIK